MDIGWHSLIESLRESERDDKLLEDVTYLSRPVYVNDDLVEISS